MTEEDLYHEALAKPAAERAAFLDAACTEKPRLLEEGRPPHLEPFQHRSGVIAGVPVGFGHRHDIAVALGTLPAEHNQSISSERATP